jgi:glycine/D-amino acid oxidase-like deaminating enzyme
MTTLTTKIAIIGGGIIGSSAAYFLSQMANHEQIQVTMYDDSVGQATKAAAGIISPWLSKRRNQRWYQLAQDGATLLKKLASETQMPSDIYQQCGTIITRDDSHKLEELYQLAEQRQTQTDTIGDIKMLSADDVKRYIPILDESLPGVLVTGGARLDGAKYTAFLQRIAKNINLSVQAKKVQLNPQGKVIVDGIHMDFDYVIVATGAWIQETLAALPLSVDSRPQKGQLIELSTTHLLASHDHMPVLMPEGEADFIPIGQSRLIIGASHENEKGFDLTVDENIIDGLLNSVQSLVHNLSAENLIRVKVGTRGYASDFAPFFGVVPGYSHLLVGGGLGSSGLTTGPLVGKILAQMAVNQLNIDVNKYRKPISNYIKMNQ